MNQAVILRNLDEFDRQLRAIDPRLLSDYDYGMDKWVVFLSGIEKYDLIYFENKSDFRLWLYELDEMDSPEQEREVATYVHRARAGISV